MSGTSMDGVDGTVVAIPDDYCGGPLSMLAAEHVDFPVALRTDLMALQSADENEIEREAAAANALARLYAACVERLLAQAAVAPGSVRSIGVHGQTIRHRPDRGFTRQTGNPSLLAELTGIDVIADFRSRDIAAGGQGAPLVPAFHRAVFGASGETRVVVNIGGISNISVLNANGDVIGFDTGPGNVLMDAWIVRNQGDAYDADGSWAASGTVCGELLDSMRNEPFLSLPPPKSTGRDLFNFEWLEGKLAALSPSVIVKPEDVQATLTAFTAITIADSIAQYAEDAGVVYACGGGAYNSELLRRIRLALQQRLSGVRLETTTALGVSPNHVEALAFAWLAHRFCLRQPGNLPSVTGARGGRVLGALYPGY
jgi:anhydro-N-acetylmuramic acid kinase